MVLFSNLAYDYWCKSKIYGINDLNNFKEYFLSFIDNSFNTSSMKIYSIQDDNISKSSINNINLLLCVENTKIHRHYKFINKFGHFNKNIQIYIYNTYSNFVESEEYIIIPVIYLQCDYFLKNYDKIYPSIHTNFTDKKFCIQVSFLKYKTEYYDLINNNIKKINSIGHIDKLKNYKIKIENDSCYHSNNLLNLLNNYKFIICFENSFTNGYITEKIFNAFFSRSIPIYIGPKDTCKYIDNNSYLNLIDIDVPLIKKLSENEVMFNSFIKNIKIKNYNNENYVIKSQNFINKITNNK